MRTSTRFIGVILLLVSLPVVFLRAADPLPDIAGKYTCKGQDVDGTEYNGTVEIRKALDTYTLNWTVPGNISYTGVGIQTDKILSVSWVSGGITGVMVYQIQADGRLLGRWALLGAKGTTQKETLTPIRK